MLISFFNELTSIVSLITESPDEPRIFDAQGKEVTSVAGPFREGHELFLSCSVTGGNFVLWRKIHLHVSSIKRSFLEVFSGTLLVRLRFFSLAFRRIHLNIVSLDWNSRRQLDGKVFLFHWSCFVLYSVAFQTSVKGRLLSSINNCARSSVAMKNSGCILVPVLNSLLQKIVRFAMNKRSNNPSVFETGNYCVRYFHCAVSKSLN